jgi:DHHC palmitoyltransferase
VQLCAYRRFSAAPLGLLVISRSLPCCRVNNCVGSNNLKFFLLFLFYTFLGGVYSALMFVVRFLLCWKAAPGSEHACREPSVYTIIACVVACVLAIFFAIFTAAMAWDQWEGMVTNTTGIESMKGWAEEETPLMHSLIEVFGEPFGWRWFAPVPLHQTGGLTGYYAWAPTDDPDAYDVRDPAIGKHFRRIESFLAEEAQRQTPEEAENARKTAVQAAAEIHRRHAIKKRPFFTEYTRAQLLKLASEPKINPALTVPPPGKQQAAGAAANPPSDAPVGSSSGVSASNTTASNRGGGDAGKKDKKKEDKKDKGANSSSGGDAAAAK